MKEFIVANTKYDSQWRNECVLQHSLNACANIISLFYIKH